MTHSLIDIAHMGRDTGERRFQKVKPRLVLTDEEMQEIRDHQAELGTIDRACRRIGRKRGRNRDTVRLAYGRQK